MAPRKTSNDVTPVKTGITNDQLLDFRKRIQPMTEGLSSPMGPGEAETIAQVSRVYSDGTYHHIALERLPATEAGEAPLTCVTEVRGPKAMFPKLVAGRKRLAIEVDVAKTANDVPQDEDLTADDDCEYQPRPTRTRAAAKPRSPPKATAATSPKTTGDRVAKRARKTSKTVKQEMIDEAALCQGVDDLDVVSHMNGDDNQSESTIIYAVRQPIASTSARK